MNEGSKRGLLIIAFLILALPYLNQRFRWINSGELMGYETSRDSTSLNSKNWFDGSYQVGVNNFYNDNIGFRADLIRLNCQLYYSLFQKTDYGGTTIGIGNYLFYNNYIDAYYGRDFVGYDVIHEKVRKLKAIQDTLTRLGKTFIMVHAPNKASVLREYIPARMRNPKGKQTNYDLMTRVADSMGINQVDFNAWFRAIKDTSKGLLIGRQGTHWTNYGAILAGDSLARYIERVRQIKMPHPYWNRVTLTTEGRTPDNDMVSILNLAIKVRSDTFCYPDLRFTSDSGTIKPRSIYIGDSYTINFLTSDVMRNEYSDWQVWYYYNQNYIDDSIWSHDARVPMSVHFDWQSAINNTDCVVLVYTAFNIPVLGNGFIEQAYDRYYPNK